MIKVKTPPFSLFSTQASYSIFECPFKCPGPARYCDDDGICRSHEEAATSPPQTNFDSPIKVEELLSPEGLDRFGHSLEFDAATGMLWLFGGYSPIYGPLNDVRDKLNPEVMTFIFNIHIFTTFFIHLRVEHIA